MSDFMANIEAEKRKIREAEQRYESTKHDHDFLGMKQAIDDIAEAQKTIHRLEQDESKRRADDAKDKALAAYRTRRDNGQAQSD